MTERYWDFPTEDRRQLISRGWFTAQYPGTCGACGTAIVPREDFIHAMPGNQYGHKRSKYIRECCAYTVEGRIDA